jgi:hypothetical protein
MCHATWHSLILALNYTLIQILGGIYVYNHESVRPNI